MATLQLEGKTIQDAFERKCAASGERFKEASELFPGGATRSARGFATWPISVERAEGARIWDADGNEYIDYYVGLGSTILGHAHPAIVKAIREQAGKGTQYGLSHEGENRWASLVKELVPSCERIRFTNSGSESTYIALRLARSFTGRDQILKFLGHYHGWYDSGTVGTWEPYDEPPIGGVPASALQTVDAIPPGDLKLLEERLATRKYAGVILEPTGGKSGMFPIRPEFVAATRELCREYGTVLIYDEVVTGFRVAPGGFQGASGIVPDITALGKALGGGVPCGAVVGRTEIFAGMGSPAGTLPRSKMVMHSGTFNGNPLSAAAGIATLSILREGKVTSSINRLADTLRAGLNRLFAAKRLKMCAYGSYSMPHIGLLKDRPDLSRSLDDQVLACDGTYQHWPKGLGNRLYQAMLIHGVNVGRSVGMLSGAHSDADIDLTLEAYDRSLDMLIAEGDLAPFSL